MKIALDFDETITLDPIFWGQVIELAKRRMHEVTIVTYRPPSLGNMDIEEYAMEYNVNVICTAGVQKASMFDADVWIDDNPATIPGEQKLACMLAGVKKNGG